VTSRVRFVTCLQWPEISESDGLAREALEARGVAVAAHPWNGPPEAFAGHDAIVLRANWDYHRDPDQFIAWLDRLEARGATVWNPPALVRWNVSKRYLLDLADRGIPVVPTVVLDRATPEAVAAVIEARGWPRTVVKPLVGASAYGTLLVDGAAPAEALSRLTEGAAVLVQPFVEEIVSRGEWSVVFVDGEVTHAVLKRPLPGEFRVQPRLGGHVETPPVPAAVVAASRAVLAVLPCPPLYARIDGVETASGWQLMEVEVNEPGLFFTYAPAAAGRFADAVVRWLVTARA